MEGGKTEQEKSPPQQSLRMLSNCCCEG